MRALFLVVSILCACSAQAQGFPTKPIRLLVTLPPGGPTDATARTIGQKVGDVLGQTLIIENKPGAGGQIAGEAVVRAPADGYTLLFGGVGTHGITPNLYKKPMYDPVKDLACISTASSTANVLLVHPSLPVHSVAELVAYAKAHPGLDYGSSGIGNSPHLTMEMFQDRAGIKLTHVPYKGGAQYSLALLTGEVKVMFNNLPGELGNIKAGKVRPLAVTTKTRVPQLPDVPTLAEAGVPGVEVTVWFGFFAPAATPKPVIAKLNEAVVKALSSPDLSERLASQVVQPIPSTPEECNAYVKAEIAKWAKVIEDAKVPKE
ncbi:MAG TPA: tripartite tricarboxylate transporter substrate binding protein [Burkholderiales bacterium]|nr:tripartite tricarboxylate transporter substrate binding protein [Burkholderiales bacterium]